MSGGGFGSTFSFIFTGVAATATFILFPEAYARTWPWLCNHAISRYGPGIQDWAPWIWSVLLAWLIFGLTRTALMLLTAIGGLILTLWLIFTRRD